MKAALLVLAAALAASTGPAAGQGSPRGGVVGERFDGYLGYAASPPSAQVRAQTEAINIRRRKLYTDLAVSRGVSPQEVGITAGCVLLRRVAVGDAYMLSDGRWRRRGPGEGPPAPDYCG